MATKRAAAPTRAERDLDAEGSASGRGASPAEDPARELDGLLAEVLDLTSVRILAAATGRVVTVRDLARELALPLASLYRRVRALQTAQALDAARLPDAATGKDVLAYTSRVGAIRVDFARAPPTIEVTFVAT